MISSFPGKDRQQNPRHLSHQISIVYCYKINSNQGKLETSEINQTTAPRWQWARKCQSNLEFLTIEAPLLHKDQHL